MASDMRSLPSMNLGKSTLESCWEQTFCFPIPSVNLLILSTLGPFIGNLNASGCSGATHQARSKAATYLAAFRPCTNGADKNFGFLGSGPKSAPATMHRRQPRLTGSAQNTRYPQAVAERIFWETQHPNWTWCHCWCLSASGSTGSKAGHSGGTMNHSSCSKAAWRTPRLPHSL